VVKLGQSTRDCDGAAYNHVLATPRWAYEFCQIYGSDPAPRASVVPRFDDQGPVSRVGDASAGLEVGPRLPKRLDWRVGRTAHCSVTLSHKPVFNFVLATYDNHHRRLSLKPHIAIMAEQLVLRGTLEGHSGWVTSLATSLEKCVYRNPGARAMRQRREGVY
jgi:hypothetical protein